MLPSPSWPTALDNLVGNINKTSWVNMHTYVKYITTILPRVPGQFHRIRSSVRQSVHPYIHPSIHPSVRLAICSSVLAFIRITQCHWQLYTVTNLTNYYLLANIYSDKISFLCTLEGRSIAPGFRGDEGEHPKNQWTYKALCAERPLHNSCRLPAVHGRDRLTSWMQAEPL